MKAKRLGILTKLVEERSDITPPDLEKFFEKQSDVYSPVWLLLAGLLLGGGTVGIIELIKEGSVIPAAFTGIWIAVYTFAFWTSVAFILAGLAIVGYIVVRYNPINVQELLVRDYLDAKAKLEDKSKIPKNRESERATLSDTPAQPEGSKPARSDSNDFGIEKIRFFWDYGRSYMTTLLAVMFTAFVGIATLANAQVTSSVIRLNSYFEAGLIGLVGAFILYELSGVQFLLKKHVVRTDALLKDLSAGNPIPSLRELCEIKDKPKSAWAELMATRHGKVFFWFVVVGSLIMLGLWLLGFGK